MKIEIGVVKSFVGKFWIESENGESHLAVVGEKLNQGDKIVGDKGNIGDARLSVSLSGNDSDILVVGANDMLILDKTILSDGITKEDATVDRTSLVAAWDAPSEQLSIEIEGDKNILETADGETAAGETVAEGQVTPSIFNERTGGFGDVSTNLLNDQVVGQLPLGVGQTNQYNLNMPLVGDETIKENAVAEITVAQGSTDGGQIIEDSQTIVSGVLEIKDEDAGEAFFKESVLSDQYGTMTINADGEWVYQLDNGSNVVQGLKEGDVIVQTFTVGSLDGTATHTITITINGTNDNAKITVVQGSVDAGSVVEDGISTASGVLSVSDVDMDEEFLKSETKSDQYGTMTISADGTWNYVLNNSSNAVQELKSSDTITKTFVASSLDGTASHIITITIDGANDVAKITVATASADVGTVKEDATITASGMLVVSDIDAGEALLKEDVVSDQYGTMTINSDGTWNYVLNNGANAVQKLKEDDTITKTFKAVSLDGTATHTITITINGTNDDAEIIVATGSDDSGSVKEDVSTVAYGTLRVSDVDVEEAYFKSETISDKYGTMSVNTDGAWSYVLDNNSVFVQELKDSEIIKQTFMATSQDGTATHEITITISGTNDEAKITVETIGSDKGSVEEDNIITASGSIVVSDVDEGEALLRVDVITDQYGTMTINVDGTWYYVLDNDSTSVQALTGADVITQTFIATSQDGVASHEIVITINGANDEARITVVSGSSDNGGVKEDMIITASGKLEVLDVDVGEASFKSEVISSEYGTMSIRADGTWNYELNNSGHVQGLNDGDVITEEFTATSMDGTGTHKITITINGTNEVLIVGSAFVELIETNEALSTSGALTTSGNVIGDFVPATTNGTIGVFMIDNNGTWTFKANSAFNELNVGQSVEETFSARAIDGASGTVTIKINGTNDAPVITAENGVMEEDGVPVIVSYAASDVDGVISHTTATVSSQQGSVVVNDNGTYIFTPKQNFNGEATITLITTDNNGETKTTTSTVIVNPVLDTFQDADEASSGKEGATQSGNLLSNPVDVNGMSLSVSSFSVGETVGVLGIPLVVENVGSITVSGDGTYTFVPLQNYSGTVPQIMYTVSNGESEDSSTLFISVIPVSDAVVFADNMGVKVGAEISYEIDGYITDGVRGVDADGYATFTMTNGVVISTGSSEVINFSEGLGIGIGGKGTEGNRIDFDEKLIMSFPEDIKVITAVLKNSNEEMVYITSENPNINLTNPNNINVSGTLSVPFALVDVRGSEIPTVSLYINGEIVKTVEVSYADLALSSGTWSISYSEWNTTIPITSTALAWSIDGDLANNGNNKVPVIITADVYMDNVSFGYDGSKDQAIVSKDGYQIIEMGFTQATTQTHTYPVDIAAVLSDNDGSEKFTAVYLSGFPAGSSVKIVDATTGVETIIVATQSLTINNGMTDVFLLPVDLLATGLSGTSFLDNVYVTTTSVLPDGYTPTITVVSSEFWAVPSVPESYSILGGTDSSILTGGEGNDYINGGLGRDTLIGGSGDDVLVSDISAGGILVSGDTMVDGGEGMDTLVLTAGVDIDFGALDGVIKNIEVIDLSQNGSHKLMNLSLQDVINMTDKNNILTIIGDEGDAVHIPMATDGFVLSQTTDVSAGLSIYTYSGIDQTVILKVDQDVVVL